MKKAIYLFGFMFFQIFIMSCGKNTESIKDKEIDNFNSNSESGYTPISVAENMVLVEGGSYIPLYGKAKNPINVANFKIDVYPVTNANYLLFVEKNPKWRKSNVKKIFAEETYLNTWSNDTTLNKAMSPNGPVTNVSWFAANAYCECNGARLPTIDEWEYVAMSDETLKDARKKVSYNQYILDWYEKNNTYKNDIGTTYKNKWGVFDMHGLVWEWTSDFNSILISGENRGDPSNDKNLFCGSGSLGANDLMNYAAFMRYAFRSSMKANYSVQNLGFRCARSETKLQQ